MLGLPADTIQKQTAALANEHPHSLLIYLVDKAAHPRARRKHQQHMGEEQEVAFVLLLKGGWEWGQNYSLHTALMKKK